MASEQYTPSTNLSTTSLTLVDIAWAAGLLEGEAAFQWSDSPKIAIQMTDEDVIERIGTLLGCPAIHAEKRLTTTGNQVFGAYVHGSRAVAWMMTLYSFMGTRRQHKITELLHAWKGQSGFPRGRRGERLPATCHPDRPRQGNGLCQECYQKTYLQTYVLPSKATCHPDKPLHAYGLCWACYIRELRRQRAGKSSMLDGLQQQAKTATCHPERPHVGRGLCNACYMKEWRKEKAQITPIAALPIASSPPPIAFRPILPTLSLQDIAWFAGLLEGEGSFAWNSSPCIALKMTDKDVMERAARLTGYTLTTYQPSQKETYKRVYSLTMAGFHATGWMMTIFPFMGMRRQEKMKTLLQQWHTSAYFPRGHKGEALPAICHPDKPRFAKGLCEQCYGRKSLQEWRAKKKELLQSTDTTTIKEQLKLL